MIQVTAPLAMQTPPDIVPDALVEFWPYVVTVAWFCAAVVLVVVLGWYVVEPAISRAVRQRNRENPTIQEAISRYVHLLTLLVALYVGAGAAGYARFVTNSSLIIAAGTLAVGVAGQTVIGSLVSGLVLVADPEFNCAVERSPRPQGATQRAKRVSSAVGRGGARHPHTSQAPTIK